MTFYIENETEKGFSFDAERLIGDVIKAALLFEKCPYEAEVSVLLTDDQGIREVNRTMRGIDQVTDVLSFPALSFASPADFNGSEDESGASNPESGELVLGDILLSVDRVKAQASSYNHSEKRELAFLVAHSMLHLMGYDHMEEEERLLMEEKQEALLDSIGLTRDCKDEE